MKSIKVFLYLLCSILIFTVCTATRTVNDKYITEQDSTIVNHEVANDIKCTELGKNAVITNNEDYKALYRSEPPYTSYCKTYKLPEVDFNKTDLVFFSFSYGSCKKAKINWKIVKIPNEKKYLLIYNLKTYGLCKNLVRDSKWVKIPKMESGYTFEFKENRTIEKFPLLENKE